MSTPPGRQAKNVQTRLEHVIESVRHSSNTVVVVVVIVIL